MHFELPWWSVIFLGPAALADKIRRTFKRRNRLKVEEPEPKKDDTPVRSGIDDGA